MKQDCVLVRYGEIALKGKNRSMFDRQLRVNMETLLKKKSIEFKGVKRIAGRFIIESNDPKVSGVVSKVFGVASVSPAFKVKLDLSIIKEKSLELFNEYKPKSFRITTNRLDKTFKETSMMVNQKVGAHIQENTGCKVSLKNPELEIGVELSKNNAYMCVERIQGPGGLPVGSSGNTICLFSGGIDSPVAAWLAMKRGSKVTLVHFLHQDDSKPKKILELRSLLEEYHHKIELILVPTGNIERELVKKAPAKLRIVLLRRIFMKIAGELCREFKAQGVVTGDNLGQVASQTLENMNTIDEAAEYTILRPLIGYDKREIVDLANIIGTYKTSIREYNDCCNFLLPKHPETKSKLSEVQDVEKEIDTRIIDEALEKKSKI